MCFKKQFSFVIANKFRRAKGRRVSAEDNGRAKGTRRGGPERTRKRLTKK